MKWQYFTLTDELQTNVKWKVTVTVSVIGGLHDWNRRYLIEVIRSSGEEMWRVDAYQIQYYSRGIEGEKRTHSRFADCL